MAIPGLEAEDTPSIQAVPTDNSLNAESKLVIQALGGAENIETVEACATRLRVAVVDRSKVDKKTLKSLGAIAVLEVGGEIQAVFGGKADLFSQEINQILGKGD